MVSLDDDASTPVGGPAPGSSDPIIEGSPSHIEVESPSGQEAVEGGSGSPEEAPKRDGVASSNLDRLLNLLILGVIVLIAVVGGYFGYTYYYQQQQARLASPALRLVDQVQALVNKTPNDPNLHARLGEALFAAGENAAAKAELLKAIQIESEFSAAYQDLAQIAMSENDYANAEKYLKRLLQLTSTGDMQNANQRRDFALFSLGELMIEQKRYTEAIGYLNAALLVDRGAADTYLRLSQAYWGTKDEANAFKNVNIALQFDPKYAEALYFRGTMYLSQGKQGAAAADFRASIDAAPDQQQPAQSLAAMGTYSAWYAKALTAFNGNDLDTALNAVRVARAIDPKSYDAQMLAGQVLVKQEDYANAVIAFQDALNIRPKDAAASSALKSAQALSKAKGTK